MRLNGRSVYGCTEAPAGFVAPPNTLLTWNPATNRLYVHLLAYPLDRLVLPGAAGQGEIRAVPPRRVRDPDDGRARRGGRGPRALASRPQASGRDPRRGDLPEIGAGPSPPVVLDSSRGGRYPAKGPSTQRKDLMNKRSYRSMPPDNAVGRRDFLKAGGAIGAGLIMTGRSLVAAQQTQDRQPPAKPAGPPPSPRPTSTRPSRSPGPSGACPDRSPAGSSRSTTPRPCPRARSTRPWSRPCSRRASGSSPGRAWRRASACSSPRRTSSASRSIRSGRASSAPGSKSSTPSSTG
ncbi:MAG: hypothetical protein MZU84_08765 [Sphingobacterium sp.]|nr:hypothetical protein [Sphingobacterium sp.]